MYTEYIDPMLYLSAAENKADMVSSPKVWGRPVYFLRDPSIVHTLRGYFQVTDSRSVRPTSTTSSLPSEILEILLGRFWGAEFRQLGRSGATAIQSAAGFQSTPRHL